MFTIFFKIKSFVIENKDNILKALISITALIIIYLEGRKALGNFNLGIILFHLHRVLRRSGWMFFLGGIIAIMTTTLYDYVVIKYLKYDLSLKKIFKISWISNTFNNFIGFAGLTGSSLRTAFYEKENISSEETIHINSIINPVTIVGLSILTWLGIFNVITIKPILNLHKVLWIAIIGLQIYLIIYFLLFKVPWLKREFLSEDLTLEEPKVLRIGLGFVSIIEWTTAGTFLWAISIAFTGNITYFEALGVFAVAGAAGIISLLPGGVGAFDLVCARGLQLMGTTPNKAIAILIVYRIFYYAVPWFLGVILSLRDMREILPTTAIPKTFSSWQKVWVKNYKEISDFGVIALSILVFFCGAILLLSAAIPSVSYRVKIISKLTSFTFMRFSHRLSIMIGVMLVVLSKGIREHLKRAYSLTIILLLTGSLFTFAKGLDYEEAIFLLIVAGLLWFSRKGYYRESAPIKSGTVILMILVSAISIGIYAMIGNSISFAFTGFKRGPKIFDISITAKQFTSNAIYAFIVAWIVLAIYFILKPKRPFDQKISNEELEKLREFLKKYEGNYLTHLLFLKDKNFYWAQDGKVLIAYSNVRDKLVALGDPIGDEDYFQKAIGEFQIFADKYALYPVFYQVSEKYLTMYHENGYYFFKLGEEAVIDLEKFSLEGKKRKSLRIVRNRFEKENFTFEMIKPPFSNTFMKELKQISDEWLNKRKEKGFSLGSFDEDYVNSAEVAILRDPEGKIIAFATMMPNYDNGKTTSVDLMRFVKEAPNGTMDALFLNIIVWAKENGYKYFNLGMAPLSNVGMAPFAHKQEKLAKLVYKFGNYWYSFSGLRRYKEKFTPEWEPKFLAYPQFMSLPTLLIDLAFLVSKGKKE
ncbi:bifunctional lysylphosphatidylglycerol flippase/synthetase MprF [Clostridium botulinum]|uniref:Phosphatidylglycerol lysyltransferase n=1 Tax=Clostridium botulinum C/D str. DC5 TaxID=1443128 RepID=A0A0A0IIA4_CLOBO|nr:bifunctional lysylphosphatidylglycerol flippase/synthetase MprF [Clostridium botulinum]MCD3234678.1 bifunctional lysylphosphatidylglycerol flippase/synthetase MprF [Clostridium botulinum D/C]KGM99991.1 lysyl transferase [Clostridium botulinum C/D str. DC5]MCD3240515.1 bifunctional lysylphosphatidylglycerol flippase/synthetase MprF [Clostridium botulinum D/C]MCD3268083.1 bifunctional lysylphosphatidylglycerol flippase/synthetase MprF [Clostridium botulinum D/C]MCD3298322.1 bifunctional lysyl